MSTSPADSLSPPNVSTPVGSLRPLSAGAVCSHPGSWDLWEAPPGACCLWGGVHTPLSARTSILLKTKATLVSQGLSWNTFLPLSLLLCTQRDALINVGVNDGPWTFEVFKKHVFHEKIRNNTENKQTLYQMTTSGSHDKKEIPLTYFRAHA